MLHAGVTLGSMVLIHGNRGSLYSNLQPRTVDSVHALAFFQVN